VPDFHLDNFAVRDIDDVLVQPFALLKRQAQLTVDQDAFRRILQTGVLSIPSANDDGRQTAVGIEFDQYATGAGNTDIFNTEPVIVIGIGRFCFDNFGLREIGQQALDAFEVRPVAGCFLHHPVVVNALERGDGCTAGAAGAQPAYVIHLFLEAGQKDAFPENTFPAGFAWQQQHQHGHNESDKQQP